MLINLRISLCIGFGILALGATRAQDEKVLFENEGKGGMRVFISKETGMVTTRLTKVNYHDVRLFSPDRRVVAKDTIVTEYADASEGEISNAKVEFFHATGDPNSADFVLPKSPTQTIEIKDVSEVKYQDDHWAATTFGCCDAETYTRLYAYGASTPFLRFNSGYAKAEVPNASHVNRYVGIVMRSQVPNDSAVAAIFGKNNSAVAAITYASAGKTLQQILLKPKDDVKDMDVPYHTMGVKLLSKSDKDVPGWQEEKSDPEVLVMWSNDPEWEKRDQKKSISGLIIQAAFDANDGTSDTVTITVDNDKFGTPVVKSKTLEVIPVESSK